MDKQLITIPLNTVAPKARLISKVAVDYSVEISFSVPPPLRGRGVLRNTCILHIYT